MCLGVWFGYLSFPNIQIRSGVNLQCPAYKGDICGHFFGMFSYLPVYQLLGMYSQSLSESELSYAQQFLFCEDMFEIDNYQSSLLELDSKLSMLFEPE